MSVRKRAWTTAKGEARTAWVVDYVDTKGKRRHQTFEKKRQADEFEKRAGVEVLDGVHVADAETVTVAEAGALWIKSGEAAGLERTTIDQRRQHLTLHITPFIGDTRLNKATVPWVREFQDKLRESGRSPGMVKRVTVSLGSILADAQGRGLAVRNAVHERSRARSSTRAAEKRAKARLQVGVDIPTTDEARAILSRAEGRWRPLLVVAVFTGMRASELRGLRWSDVDLDKALVHVRQRADRYNAIGMPKSDAGQRSIPISPMVVNTLKEWKLACPKGELGLVFPNGAGKVEAHQNITARGLWPIEIAAGVTTGKGSETDPLLPKYPGLHALRHWFASWCINRKVDGGLELTAKAVQERMGHSSIQVTFDTYGHLFPVADEHEQLAAADRAFYLVDATGLQHADKKA
ncbi:MAG: tyrosine-type recombinase/integrase [Devosia sp.]